MGCTSSKLDDLPAVSLCRERCSHLDEAIRHRYAFAEAHMAYIIALKTVAHSMHVFLDSNFDQAPTSPVLNLTNQRKGEPVDPGHLSDSGSHLHFHSDEDSDGSELGELHNSGHSSPRYLVEYMNANQEGVGGFATFQGGFLHMNYMKKTTAAPTVVYSQRPMSHENVQVGESSSSYYPYPYPGNNVAPYPYFGHTSYGGGIGGGSGNGQLSSAPALQYTPYPAAPSAQASRKPPSPLRSSGWDYLDPFGASYEGNFYEQYTPARNSRDVREDEGIPDLEDEEYQYEVVEEVYGRPKFIETGNLSRSVAVDDGAEGREGGVEAVAYQKKPTLPVPEEKNKVEYEVHAVDNNVADANPKKAKETEAAPPKTSRGIDEVVKEIELQFERASESGIEIAAMLEVGKFHYRRKCEVASKMVQPITTTPLVVSSEASTSMASEEEVEMRFKNLSSTLHKLYLWEKKLYNEVKSEEKMRVIHDRKVQKLKRLDQRGAEAAKIDATRTLIRNLSSKIRIAIQVVEKMSITINKIQDEELWPQLNELIQGLTRMWRCMLECHKIQSQVIGNASGFSSIGSGRTLSDTHLEATLQFGSDLINWTSRFANWVSSQKGYIKSLNGWLSKCVLYEPEESSDGIITFSPSRVGAPPVFIICNQWAQSLDTVSEKEVLDALRVFVSSVLQLWRQDKHEMKERMLGNKDLEKNLDKKDVQIQKEVQALEKNVVIFTGNSNDDSFLATDEAQAVYPGDASRNLQSSLHKIFEAMEKFMDSSSRVYEDLLHRCEEEKRSVAS